MTRPTMTQREFLARHAGHVRALEFEDEYMLAEGADVLAVVGALLWAAATVASGNGVSALRFARLVDAMITSAVECNDDGEDEDAEDGEEGAWGNA